MKRHSSQCLTWIAAVLAAAGCAGGTSGPVADATGGPDAGVDGIAIGCTPGRVKECPCAGGGTGVQTCGDDGRHWGECEGCESSGDAGPDSEIADAQADAGTDAAADTGDDTGWFDSGPDVGPDTDVDGGCVPACAGKCAGDDGCGGTCPDACAAPLSCGGGGTPDECGCTVASCDDLGVSCGDAQDGCGAMMNCGACGANQSCNVGSCSCEYAACGGACCAANEVCEAGLCAGRVAAPQMDSPGPCQDLATMTTTEVRFSVPSLDGIDHFTFDVMETGGCNEEPAGGSVAGYPAVGLAQTPGTHILRPLLPGRWYKLIVESSAQAGSVSAETAEWFRTAGDAIAIAAGHGHNCVLNSSGGVVCWGLNESGQIGDGTTYTDRLTPVAVKGLESGVRAIAAGASFSCALTDPGGVKCWGSDNHGQLGDDATYANRSSPVDVSGLKTGVAAIAAGGAHACALTEGGGVKCWGSNGHGAVGDGSGVPKSPEPVDVAGLATGVTAITAGGGHTCALMATGGVRCWGFNDSGQIGDGSRGVDRPEPVDVSGLQSAVVAFAAGASHTCAVLFGGGVKCWGNSGSGQIGDGSIYTDVPVPSDVSGLQSGVVEVTSGYSHTCALTAAGAFKCWGDNIYGQIGDGTKGRERSKPVDVVGTDAKVVAIAAGGFHTCALTREGHVRCWGDNEAGQLGGGGIDTKKPVDAGLLKTGVSAIAAGGEFSCAITAAGAAECWGAADEGQIGDGITGTDRVLPFGVFGMGASVAAVSAGDAHACALSDRGGVKCWGRNREWEIGTMQAGDFYKAPADVVGLGGGIVSIAAGMWHTCAVTETGGVKCWGANESGQIGDGTRYEAQVPEDVDGLNDGVSAVAAGGHHTCALLASGGVRCWGSNVNGQVGNGTAGYSVLAPTDVSGLQSGISAITAGEAHTCALTSVGGIKCWGLNDNGQLGDSSKTIDRLDPVDVRGLESGAVAIFAGDRHTCALKTGGSAVCWGKNDFGQIGNGAMGEDRLTPANVADLGSGVVGMAAGASHTCAVTAAGGVKCWGRNNRGQVGAGFVFYVAGF